MNESANPVPEFSYEIDVGEVSRAGKTFHLVANESEREKVAARLQTPSVEKLEGDMKVTASKTAVRITCDITAELTRECVASLEPLQETVSESFEIDFTRIPPEAEDEENLDAPEYLEGAALDLGELLVQQLSLAMDPFPRKEGAQSLAEAYAPEEKVSPFAALKGVVGKSDDNQ